MDDRILLTVKQSADTLSLDAEALGAWETEEGRLTLLHNTAGRDGGGLHVSTVMENRTEDTLHPEDVPFAGVLRIRGGRRLFTHAYVECQAMLGPCGPQPLADGQTYESCGLMGLTDADGTCAMLFGMERTDDHFYRFTLTVEEDELLITPLCAHEGIALAPGKSVTAAGLTVTVGRSLSALLTDFADALAERYPRRPQGEIKTGWCSWYHYYSTESEEDILRTASELADSGLRDKLSVILLDDGWNLPSNQHPCVWGDWEAGGKFPEGMKAVADAIHARGFEAGLWLAPFAVAKDSRLLCEHPDWIIGAGEGLVNNNASVFGLDVTHPGAARSVSRTARRRCGRRSSASRAGCGFSRRIGSPCPMRGRSWSFNARCRIRIPSV